MLRRSSRMHLPRHPHRRRMPDMRSSARPFASQAVFKAVSKALEAIFSVRRPSAAQTLLRASEAEK